MSKLLPLMPIELSAARRGIIGAMSVARPHVKSRILVVRLRWGINPHKAIFVPNL